MQPYFHRRLRTGLAGLVLAAAAGLAQTGPPPAGRAVAQLVAHEIEVTQGCATQSPAPRKETLQAGQPLPIPPTIACNGVELKFSRLRLNLPVTSPPGTQIAAGLGFDAPVLVGYDIAADWTGNLRGAMEARVDAPGLEACRDSLQASVSAQSSRVCEWTTAAAPATAGGFIVEALLSFTSTGPVFILKSTARYAIVAAPAIERIEAVQAVQTENGQVPLYAGRPTYLRVFPQGAGDPNVRLQLDVRPPAGAAAWRHTAPRMLVAPATLDRVTDRRSWTVPLPADLTAAPGLFTVEAQLQTATGRVYRALDRPFSFTLAEPLPSPAAVLLWLCETAENGQDRVCPSAATATPSTMLSMARQILPAGAPLMRTPLMAASLHRLAPRSAVARQLGRMRLLLDEQNPAMEATAMLAVLPAAGDHATRGWAEQAWVAGRAALASDDATHGPGQLAHGWAKLLGVTLTPGDAGDLGVDARSGEVAGPAAGWISAASYTSLVSAIAARKPLVPRQGEYLTVSGTLSHDRVSGSLDPAFRTSGVLAAAPTDAAGLTCLRLTAPGPEVATHCFTLEALAATAETEDAFAVRLPWLAGARQLVLLHDGAEIAVRNISDSPPQAEILTPSAGNRIPSGQVTIQWNGSDLDGDTLRYDLLISVDDAATWFPLAVDLERNDFTFDAGLVPAGVPVHLQLRYSDGLQSAVATSGPFEFLGSPRSAAPASVTLPATPAGQVREFPLLVTNSGDSPLVLETAAPTGSGTPAVEPAPGALPLIVPPGVSAPLRMRVAPPAIGAFTSPWTLGSLTAPLPVTLVGRGTHARDGQIEVSPETIEYGSVALTQSRDLNFTLGNGGALPLTVQSPRLAAGSAFRITGFDAPLTLAPGAQQTFTARFAPTALGGAYEMVRWESDDPVRRTLPLALSGRGVELVIVNAPRVQAQPSPSVQFGDVRMGVPARQTVTLRNAGNAPLVVSRVSATPADYSVRDLPALPFTLAPGAAQAFVVRLDAAAPGARLGQLQIASNDPDTPVLNLGLTAIASLPTTGTVVLSLDDGTFERHAGFASGDGYFLNRMTPPAYPATLKAIRIYIGERSSLFPGDVFGLLWAPHPQGGETLGALRMQSRSATVANNRNEFVEYPVTPQITIESGDFLVGFTAHNSASAQPAALDTSTNILPPVRTYASRDGGEWRSSVLWPGFPSGVFAVRAVVELGARPGN
ncbi:MAG: choice-of-anchor D domain-containing protein [Bryobacterales bacterium]|nr:choice-of-anchor D domain-containing protein [Bryobacterales bacterium]